MIKVRVRAFAGLREALGTGDITLTLPEGTDVAGLLAELAALHLQARLPDRRFSVAVNRSYAALSRVVADGDEVALIPPVSGGSVGGPRLFEVVTGPISLDAVASRLVTPERGGVTLFAGTVRGVTRPGTPGEVRTDYLEYEAYPEMAEESFARIAAEAQARWPAIGAVAVVHRIGRLEVGEVSIAIAVAAGHRADTFDACHYIIDRIKQISPIWKREVGQDGSTWVEGPESLV